jgi:competence protein CoiA
MLNQFAMDTLNRFTHISEVERGLNCHCFCVVCGEKVVAKKGVEREHHFAHESNKATCVVNPETLLHKFAKRVIQEAGGLVVPPALNYRLCNLIGVNLAGPSWLMLDRIEEEKRLDGIRPDLIGYFGITPVLIEVAYSSFSDFEKQTKLEELGLVALEIDLSAFHPENFDPTTTKDAIVNGVDQKYWLYCPEPAPIVQQSACISERITIKGIWVYLRKLPSGDLAIKVAVYNPEVYAIVKGIAKGYFGQWRQDYKNWIVPSHCYNHVMSSLQAAAESA